jgi:hypothetical protein
MPAGALRARLRPYRRGSWVKTYNLGRIDLSAAATLASPLSPWPLARLGWPRARLGADGERGVTPSTMIV